MSLLPNKPRFNFVSQHGDGFGFTQWLKSEGYSVRMWIAEKDGIEIGDGLVEKVGDFTDLLEGAQSAEEVFIFDTSGMGIEADFLRSKGYAVLGGSMEADVLERNRKYAMEVMQDCQISVPPTFTFTNFDEAIEFVQSYEDRLVYKPSGKLGDLSGSHVSYDQGDMIDYLRNQQKEHELDGISFDLQTFTEGQEISSECWFDGYGFLPLFNHTLERKQLMNDNLGPSGGCTGNIVWMCDGNCPICQRGTRKLEKFLRSIGYIGPIDLNSIVTEDSLYGLEFTPRFGYDATPTFLGELVRGSIGELLSSVARKQTTFAKVGQDSEITYGDKLAASLRISIPPWPSERYNAPANIPLGGVSLDSLPYTYLYNVKRASEGQESSSLCSAGAWGILLLFNSRGSSVGRAFATPYEQAEQVKIPDKQFRTDLREQFKKDLEKLEEFNLIDLTEGVPRGIPTGIY